MAKTKAGTAARPKKRSPGKSKSASDLLFEIGTEELPYQFVPAALAALRESAETLFKDARLTYGSIRLLGTPRRLTLIVEAMADRQAPAVKEVMGPSKAVAYDTSGNPTRALQGFMAGQRIELPELEIRQTPKGEYVYAVKRDAGRPTAAVLADLLPQLVTALSFPKSMRWNATGLKFARPIRWLLALYAGRAVSFDVGGVASGQRTWGHRFLVASAGASRQGIAVKDGQSYVRALQKHGVIADPDARRAMIADQLAALAKTAHGIVHRDEELLEQAVFTVEYPHAILGTFHPDYLSVPKDVLMTAMKEHQGFFSLVKKDGSLLPAFISITNMKLRDMRLIQEGNERVLAARLADAKFFFDEDRKIKLIDRVDRLKGVTFHHKLGTYLEKTQRVRDLATWLAGKLATSYDQKTVCRLAAEISKADLLTGLVGEFPTLQGIMGGEYAKADGMSDEISRAVRDQYLPRGMDGKLPETLPGKILSIADRLDSIVAFFYAGILPKGSEDPYALRRNAISVVRIILEGNLKLDLSEAVKEARNIVELSGIKEMPSMMHDPLSFIFERFRYYAGTVAKVRDDVVAAVCGTAYMKQSLDLFDILHRLTALQAITDRKDFDPLIIGFKRAHRIIEKESWDRLDVDPSLFQHNSEAELQNALLDAQKVIPRLLKSNDYVATLDALVRMKPAIDDFFNGVLVNADDERLRANRLSLLCAVDRLFLSVADFSHISVQGA